MRRRVQGLSWPSASGCSARPRRAFPILPPTPVFSFPAIGCAPTKCTRGRHERFRPFDQITLHAADITHNGAGLKAGGPFLEMPFIRIDRCR